MRVLHERCCGLDVRKKTVVACLLTPAGKRVRPCGTTTRELLALGEWLGAQGCTHVAMEATGVFWKPVVRHEALFDREGMKGPLLRAVAAAGRS